MEGIDPHILDLQLRFMKLERELAELSGIVAAQQQTIDALKLEARRRREREEAEREAQGPPDERPPHY
jgi:uncharacterized coiled-coil protein SlyX